jgi:patatin-like phospholipase/acyl hydrolase
MKKILNIDGGGVRVYFPLLILNEIEKRTNTSIVDLFDYFAGVSASSIVLSGLLTRYSISDIIELFKKSCKSMFYRSYVYTVTSGFGMFYSKYPSHYIEESLKEIFQEDMLSDCKKPMSILTYDLKHNVPLHFSSYKHHPIPIKLWQVVRGSTSAPTYFPPYEVEDYILIDGGIVTNNLSELSFIKAMEYYGTQEEYVQLSLGTGYSDDSCIPSGMWGWSNTIFDVMFKATSTYEMNMLKKISKFENLKRFYRLDLKLKTYIYLDDYNAFDKMDKVFVEWLEQNDAYIDDLCKQLTSNELVSVQKQDSQSI